MPTPLRASAQPGHTMAMGNALARAVSIVGHPAVLMPVAALVAAPAHLRPAAFAVSVVGACVVMAYSLYKARRGAWTHVDASVPTERAQLNVRLAIGLLLAACALWLAGLHVGIPLVVGLSGLIAVAAHLFRGVAKLSLHVAFAVLAAFLVWPHAVAAAALALGVVAVAWSRLALRRHVVADVVLGAIVGAVAGGVFRGGGRVLGG